MLTRWSNLKGSNNEPNRLPDPSRTRTSQSRFAWMQELVRRGEQVTCSSNKAFRMQIEQTGAEVRDYPEIKLSAAAVSKSLEEGNLE